jgi:drug/metabolite transporter (DMT)-like permease
MNQIMDSTGAAAPAHRATPPRVYGAVAVGLLAMSFASIFIRFAQNEGVPSLVIAMGRLTLAALVLTPVVLARHRDVLRLLRRGDYLLAAASGALLAAHFATWILSLEYTSVLVSVVLVTTSSLWAALLEFFFLRIHLRPVVIAGLLLAIGGGILIGLGGAGQTIPGSNPVLGGGLALAGAVSMALYLVIGRTLAVRVGLVPYIWLVYGCAAITLMIVVVLTATPVAGYSAQGYLWVALLGLAPQLIGHTSLNYALQYMSATYVSIATQMEPIGSAIAAFFIFHERPAPLQIVGSVVILVGVIVASLRQPEEAVRALDEGT